MAYGYKQKVSLSECAIMFQMLCSLWYCYTIFSIDNDNNSTSCDRHGQVLETGQLMDLFETMNSTTEETGKLYMSVTGGYFVYIQMENPKGMVIISTGNATTRPTHVGCMYKRTGSPILAIFSISLAMAAIIILAVLSINRVIKYYQHHQPPWERFLSTLKRSNMAPQNNSS